MSMTPIYRRAASFIVIIAMTTVIEFGFFSFDKWMANQAENCDEEVAKISARISANHLT